MELVLALSKAALALALASGWREVLELYFTTRETD